MLEQRIKGGAEVVSFGESACLVSNRNNTRKHGAATSDNSG